MRRADRLFQIVQILRRTARPVTADAIAAELETSKRSVYRDIAALIGQRVPIRGEAGVGYVLDGGFDLPPLMLTSDEVEAAVLGAQWVAGRGDAALARAARDLIAKIAAVVPEDLRPLLADAAGPDGARLADPCRRDRCRAGASLDSQRQEDRDPLHRPRWACQRAGGLADRDRIHGSVAHDGRLVRNAPGLSAASGVDRVTGAEFLDHALSRAGPSALRRQWLAQMRAKWDDDPSQIA